MKDQVRQTIKSMESNKAMDSDGIHIEMIGSLDEIGVDATIKLIDMIYDTGEIPKDLTKLLFITLPKNV